MRWHIVLPVTFALSRTALAADPLPEGDAGIAAGYPDDVGIDGDPAVVFFDDFEGYADASELPTRWTAAVYQVDQTRLATEPENVFAGARTLEFTVPQQDNELSNSVDRAVSPELDLLFLRYYARFQGPYDVVGSSHNGSMIASHYFIDGQATPGVPADGTNKWLANLENWRGEPEVASPGLLNIYIYHPEQRSEYGDHFYSDGTITPYDPDPPPDYFGPDFVPRPNVIPALDEWHCYEFMVVANTPGQRDGRIAFWYDGALAGDFQNLRMRDIDALKIDRFGLNFHIGSNPNGVQHKWYDNVVAASAYIGPRSRGGGDDTGSTSGDPDTGDPGPFTDSDDSMNSNSDVSTDGPSPTGSDDPTSGGSLTSGPDDTGGATGGGPGSEATITTGGEDKDDGCGCTTSPTAPAPLALLVLLLRRRRITSGTTN